MSETEETADVSWDDYLDHIQSEGLVKEGTNEGDHLDTLDKENKLWMNTNRRWADQAKVIDKKIANMNREDSTKWSDWELEEFKAEMQRYASFRNTMRDVLQSMEDKIDVTDRKGKEQVKQRKIQMESRYEYWTNKFNKHLRKIRKAVKEQRTPNRVNVSANDRIGKKKAWAPRATDLKPPPVKEVESLKEWQEFQESFLD